MVCPHCGGKVVVKDTISTRDNEVYRKRKCTVCKRKFFTIEFEIEYTDDVAFELSNTPRRESMQEYFKKE